MSEMQEKIKALNQIVSMIDSKAATYKNDRHHMHGARVSAEKKLLFDLINQAEELGSSIIPEPVDLLEDLARLKKTL